MEYTFDTPEDYLFGQPTSDDTIYECENPNVDRSKNTALIAPGFGTPTSYLPGSGEYLTPNLVPAHCLAVWSIRWAVPEPTPLAARRAVPSSPASTPR